jgi:hypothetical protein
VDGARVVVFQSRANWEGSTVAGSSRFSLAAGAYIVSVTKQGYKPVQTEVVVADRNVLREFALTPVASYYDLTVVAKAGRRPVPGAEVTVWLGGVKKAGGATDAAGRFTAKGLGLGYYTVDVIGRGYMPSRTPQVVVSNKNVRQEVSLTPFSLSPGYTTPGDSDPFPDDPPRRDPYRDYPRRDRVPPKARSFNLTIVVKADNEPAPASVVVRQGRTVAASGTTDENGRYSATGLRAGSYTVIVTPSNPRYAAKASSVALDSNKSVEIVLRRGRDDDD